MVAITEWAESSSLTLFVAALIEDGVEHTDDLLYAPDSIEVATQDAEMPATLEVGQKSKLKLRKLFKLIQDEKIVLVEKEKEQKELAAAQKRESVEREAREKAQMQHRHQQEQVSKLYSESRLALEETDGEGQQSQLQVMVKNEAVDNVLGVLGIAKPNETQVKLAIDLLADRGNHCVVQKLQQLMNSFLAELRSGADLSHLHKVKGSTVTTEEAQKLAGENVTKLHGATKTLSKSIRVKRDRYGNIIDVREDISKKSSQWRNDILNVSQMECDATTTDLAKQNLFEVIKSQAETLLKRCKELSEPLAVEELHDKEKVMKCAQDMSEAIVYNQERNEKKQKELEAMEKKMKDASSKRSEVEIALAEKNDKIRALMEEISMKTTLHEKTQRQLKQDEEDAARARLTAGDHVWRMSGIPKSQESKKYAQMFREGNFATMPSIHEDGSFKIFKDTELSEEQRRCVKRAEDTAAAVEKEAIEFTAEINILKKEFEKEKADLDKFTEECEFHKATHQKALTHLWEGVDDLSPEQKANAMMLQKIAQFVENKASTIQPCKDELSEFLNALGTVNILAASPATTPLHEFMLPVQQLYEMTTRNESRGAMLEKLGTTRLMQLVTPPVDPGQSLAEAIDGIIAISDDPAKKQPTAPATKALLVD